MTPPRPLRAVVVVLGDLGRSPRMQLHALALARGGAEVRLVGYRGAPVFPEVAAHGKIKVCPIGDGGQPIVPRTGGQPIAPRMDGQLIAPRAGGLPRRAAFGTTLRMALRAGAMATRLFVALVFRGARPDIILVQTPPPIPTLLVALFAARIRRARLVADWHNFGWTLLGQKIGDGHPLTRLVRWHERAIGRRADGHFCVSDAMASVLAADVLAADVLAAGGPDKRPVVFRDCPPVITAPARVTVRRQRLARLGDRLHITGDLVAHPDAPVLVSGTSWSLDEDFSVLLDAADRYDALAADAHLPHLIVVITGRGPLRAAFERAVEHRVERRVERRAPAHVHIRTAWLGAPDYRALLTAADLGLSFHRSSSGVDLAMKVADMQGAGLPVCALDYGPCLREQIDDGDTGLVFRDGAHLARHLALLFAGFPEETDVLDRLRRATARARGPTWEENWRRVVGPELLAG